MNLTRLLSLLLVLSLLGGCDTSPTPDVTKPVEEENNDDDPKDPEGEDDDPKPPETDLEDSTMILKTIVEQDQI